MFRGRVRGVESVQHEVRLLGAMLVLGQCNGERLDQANALFNRLQSLEPADPRFPTLEKLRLQWSEQVPDDSNSATG